ncbi:MAG: hypothetical protein LBG83_05000 [Oscillospiraceae bacterium]|jgi:hypothetical protein|nr:hypothetical protein [Oscillospiraceae bacterium]
MKDNSMKKTIKEATEEWVRDFTSIPQDIVIKLHKAGDEIYEVTPGNDDYDSLLPMWGTMWSFRTSADGWWIEKENNRQAMADCGFRIYEQEDYGYIFGIDGAGYDFYEAHWIPLYKARGLKWHCD